MNGDVEQQQAPPFVLSREGLAIWQEIVECGMTHVVDIPIRDEDAALERRWILIKGERRHADGTIEKRSREKSLSDIPAWLRGSSRDEVAQWCFFQLWPEARP